MMLSKLSSLSSIALFLTTVSGAANQLQQITNFGSNPSNVGFYLYVPTKLQSNPPVLVNPHWCHGSAAAAFTGTQLATLADTYGYIMIFPDSPNTSDKCWDVSSPASLTHGGGGDTAGVVSMVQWTLNKYAGNPARVFSMGTSSGAMMTNALLATYPDVFAAGSAWAGVPYGCFADPKGGADTWSDDCAKGKIIKTGAEWAALVKAAYPGYTGYRPKMQVFHGSADTTLYPQNLQEEIKEWTAVLGLPSSPVSTSQNTPLSGWTKSVYGPSFEAYEAKGVTHDIQTQADLVLSWFDLKCAGTGCFGRTGGTGGPASAPATTLATVVASSSTAKVPAATAVVGAVKWGQW
jgi:acetylxylan esterase